jgi:hypothetical protein
MACVFGCDGTSISQNTFYNDSNGLGMRNCGEPGGYYCTVANNSITATGPRSIGLEIHQQDTGGNGGYVAVYVNNNSFITNNGTGLFLGCDDGDVQHVDVLVQGNDFHNNSVGVEILGPGANFGFGDVDLGGGANNDGLGTSLGGNDFRGFTTLGTTSAAAIVLGDTSLNTVVSAANNMFSPGVSPASVVDDGVEGSLTGTGQINAAAKLDDAHAYVQGLYNDLLGRSGTMTELKAWVNVLNTQGQAAVANDILRSSESPGRIVDSFYLRFLGRQSDAAGRAAWINILQQGATLESVEAGFLTSPDYLGHIDTDFVQSLYLNLLGRTGSSAELALWNNDIQALGLAGIASAFLTAQEYRGENVIADFTSFLHRSPSPAETSAFAGTSLDLLGIEAAILSSQECSVNI